MSENAASMMHTPNGDIEQKFIDAKAYLQTTSTKSGDNLYLAFLNAKIFINFF